MQKILMDRNWFYAESDLVNKLLLQVSVQWRPVQLPHDISVAKERSADAPAGLNEGFLQAAGLYYKKEFMVSADASGKQFWLEFEGIAGVAQIWVNGQFVAKHRNPYTGLLVDVSRQILPGLANEIMVYCDNRAKPNSRWFCGTGLYRHVWLHVGEEAGVRPQSLQVATLSLIGDQVRLAIRAQLGTDQPCQVVCSVTEQNGQVIACQSLDWQGAGFNTELTVAGITPWSPESPVLYQVNLQVNAGEVSDTAAARTGFRTIAVDSRNGFRLNGQTIKLKGGCIHHDLGILGAASHDAAERRKVQLLKDSGYNALRLAHNPFSPGLLDACDELGLLVVAEAFDEWVLGRTSFGHYLTFEDDWAKDLENMIGRDFNHPSIFMWSTGNEVEERDGSADGYDWSRKLADKVRSLDPSRPTSVTACSLPAEYGQKAAAGATGNQAFNMAHDNFASGTDLWGDATAAFFAPVDVAGYNYKTVRYAHDAVKFPDRVVYGSETYPVLAFDSWQATLENPNVIGDFVWTAMDYLGESGLGRFVKSEAMMPPSPTWPWLTAHCGDLDLIGSKRPQGHYRDVVWQRDHQPRLFVLSPELTGHRIARMSWTWDPVEPCYTWPGHEGQPIEAHIYANADEVELLQNGRSLGRRPVGLAQERKAVFQLIYEPGELVAIAYAGGAECGRSQLATLEGVARLDLIADRPSILADGIDLSFVRITAVDRTGQPAYREGSSVTVTCQGGELIALGNADPMPDRLLPFQGPSCPLYHGEALAVIRSSEGSDGCLLTATLDNGLQASLVITYTPVAMNNESHFVSEIKPGVLDVPIGELMADPAKAEVLRRLLSSVINHPMFDKMQGLSLKKLAAMGGGQMLPAEQLAEIERQCFQQAD